MSTTLVVKILPSDRSNPPGKLADAPVLGQGRAPRLALLLSQSEVASEPARWGERTTAA
jgi:hypothetical protein